MKSFNDILKKGKSAVNISDPKEIWKSYITSVMHGLHVLNKMYGDDSKHHLLVEQNRCIDCSETTFILAVKNWDDRKRVLRFHQGDWQALDKNKYRCLSCSKKGK